MKEFELTYGIKDSPSRDELIFAASKAEGVPVSKISEVKIIKRSLDARSRPVYRYRVRAYTVSDTIPEKYGSHYKDVSGSKPVIIVGGGPAGMFAALKLLNLGLKPVIIERGKDVHSRKYDIASVMREQKVNGDSNYCFGEGGAGTFSDGKLFTRSNKRGDIYQVLHQLVGFGAPEKILIDSHPHIGSDILPRIVEKIRECILSHGGEYHFSSKVEDLRPPLNKAGEWKVICRGGECFSSEKVILATGHSARDIYELFASKGWALQVKGFAIGVRVEHPQEVINEIRYRGWNDTDLPPAEYSIVEQVDGRGVFSFCMCPGGILVPSPTSDGELVLNGMSNSMRNSVWANSGIVCSVEPDDVPDFSNYGVFSLLEFQRSVERKMFSFTNSLKAPSQRMTDFCKGVFSSSLPKTSYVPGAAAAQLSDLLPEFVTERLSKAFILFDRKMRGYYTNEALLLACESRTSSPVRIPRDHITLSHISLPGLLPCGEGSGYAGGIVSSAIDGINAACAAAGIYGKQR